MLQRITIRAAILASDETLASRKLLKQIRGLALQHLPCQERSAE